MSYYEEFFSLVPRDPTVLRHWTEEFDATYLIDDWKTASINLFPIPYIYLPFYLPHIYGRYTYRQYIYEVNESA